MSELRRPIRLQVETPGKVYAVVEEASPFGTATVKLATNGARLTNLAVHGQAVAAGQRVVVDYSSEGKPYIRPLTIITSGDDVITLGDTEEEIEDPGFICGRWTITDERAALRLPLEGNLRVYFNEVVWGGNGITSNLSLQDRGITYGSYCIGFEHSGKYLISATVGIEIRQLMKGNYLDAALMFYVKPWNRPFSWSEIPVGIRRRRLGDSTGQYILNANCITQISSEDILNVQLDLNATNSNWVADWNLAKDLPKYPVLDIWRITPDSLSERSTRGWFWYVT